MDVTVQVFGLVLVAAIAGLAPVVVARQSGREARATRQEEWKRQDEVAKRQDAAAKAAAEAAAAAAAAAVEVKDQAKVAAALLLESTKAQQASTDVVIGSLGVIHRQATTIHTLVNSDMTKEMEARLAALVNEHAMQLENLTLRERLGEPVTDLTARIAETAEEIARQQIALADRTRANEAAEKQVEAEQEAQTHLDALPGSVSPEDTPEP